MTTPANMAKPNPIDVAQGPAIGPGPDATPYYSGPADQVYVGGDADAGGRDIAMPTVPAAVNAAHARITELASDTYGLGSTMGDLIDFPAAPLDPGAGVGNTSPTGAFYDPGRGYGSGYEAGGLQGAPGYQGEAQ